MHIEVEETVTPKIVAPTAIPGTPAPPSIGTAGHPYQRSCQGAQKYLFHRSPPKLIQIWTKQGTSRYCNAFKYIYIIDFKYFNKKLTIKLH